MKNALKKAISVLLVAFMVFGSAPLAGFVGLELPELDLFNTKAEATETAVAPASDFEYTVDSDGNVTITKYAGTGGASVKIPSTIEGKPVTTIGERAFEKVSNILDALYLPNSIKTIEQYAFYRSLIHQVNFGDGVETIGDYAFYQSDFYGGFIGTNLKYIGTCAFNSMSFQSLMYLGTQEEWNSVEIAEDNDAIDGKVVFLGDSDGKNFCMFVYDSEGYFIRHDQYLVGTILNMIPPEYSPDDYAGTIDLATGELIKDFTMPARNVYARKVSTSERFDLRINLNGGTIDSSVLPEYVIDNGDGTLTVKIPFNTELSNRSVSDEMDMNDIFGGLYPEKEMDYFTGIFETIDGITSHDSYTLTNINGVDFCAVFALSNIWTLNADGDLFIKEGDSSFMDETAPWLNFADSIKNVIIKDGLEDIGAGAFAGCINLKSVTIPESVMYIDSSAFKDCDSLTNITIPDSVNHIGDEAFFSCDSLTSITIPDGVTCIYDLTFAYCENLTSVTIPDGVIEIGAAAFYFCTGLTSVTIPESVMYIGSSAFKGCDSLTNITIPDSVLSIGGEAFFSCDSLTSITIPDGVTCINDLTFAYCENLTSVTIGNGVTEIGKAFCGCTNLTSITIPYRVEVIGDYAFSGCTSLSDVYYTGRESEWNRITIGIYNDNLLNATIHFNENPRILTGSCGDNLTWTFDEATGILTISGEGKIENWDFKYASYVTELIVPDGVTGIGAEVFYAFDSLTSVTIPDSVNYIGDGAFSCCYSLEEISLPAKMEYLGVGAFLGCELLSEVTVPDGVNELVETFVGCYSLSKVTLPASVTLIDSAFEWGAILPDIYFQGSRTQWNSIEISDDLSNSNIYYAFSQVTWNADAETIVDFYEPGSAIIVPENPVKEGCAFVGWDAEIPETAPDYDLVFNAGFTPNSYTVTWIVDGKETVDEYSYGDEIVVPETPTKEHYTFVGWGTEIPETVPDEDLVFTAQWKLNKHTVTWMVDGEETVDEYSYGDEIVIPETPTKEGYTFVGWDTEIPATVPDENLIFTAQWELNKHTVTWIVDGDESVVEYNYGEEIIVPEMPVKEGYAFSGWTPEIPSTMPDNSLAFTAVFTANSHTVTWIVDGVETVVEYNYGDEIVVPETPYKTGYIFNGWDAKIPSTMPDEDLIFTAQWGIGKYTVTWNVDGEKTVSEYVYGDEIAVPESPVKEGYTFNGWTPAVPDTMPEQDLEFTATWLADVLTGTCGENATWTLDVATGELVINGTGEIYAEAFFDNNTIKSVKISEGITKIGTYAFARCQSLTSVVFPESLVEIGNAAFDLCFNLSEIVLPGNIKRMGGNPFRGTAYAHDNIEEDGSVYVGTCLIEAANTPDFIIKEGTTVIAAGAFRNRQYSRLVIPAGVEYIPERLFENASITELVIPYTINTINDFLFGSYWRANIGKIYFSGSPSEWERIYFEGDPNSTQYNAVRRFFEFDVEMIFDSKGYGQEGNYTYSINKFNEAVITEFSGTCNGELVIPETLGGYPVTGIGYGVFSNRQGITTVNIPERITYIGGQAFYGCTNLINFTLPDVPIHIGYQVIENTGYYNDENNWHKDILYAGNHLITRKGDDLGFVIKEGAIKDGIITIANGGLFGTILDEGMGDTLILPDSLVYIEEAAFMYSGILNVETPDGYTYSTPYNVEIPDSVTYLGPHAFAMSRISSVKLSSRLTEIYECTFYECVALETLTVPLRVDYIDTGVFYGCENLSSIVLPKSLQIINDTAFANPCLPDDVYYEGTEEDWEKVTGKELLEASMIHFNYEYENIYSVKWVVDGQKTVVDYIIGEEIIIPETPVKEGYTFAGWSAEIPSTMPAMDLVFTAQWEINKHTVTWIVGGKETVDEYSYGDEIVVPENPAKQGYAFAGWGAEIPATVPDEDLIFTAQWEINKHTVTWIVDGEKTVVEYNYGDKIVVPQNPTKEGYTFYYWDESIPSKMPDRDLIFNAVWRIRKHTVTWIVDGEKTVVNYNYGDEIVVPENPSKEGYTFAGWGAEIPATVPDEDLIFTAQWEINKHTVTWIVYGEETVDEYNYGDEIIIPETPTKEGYTFAGWGAELPSTMPDEDLTFTAQWVINKHTVTWIVDGEETVDEYDYGDEIVIPEIPTKEGYTFVGWGAEIPVTVSDEDLIFTAQWEIKKYTIKWVADGKETVVEYKCGDKIDVLVPQADGLTFVKWIPEVPATMPAENLEFTAVFESKSYTVEWNIDGLIMSETYKFGDKIDKTKMFNKKGYTFVGWSPEIPDTMPAQNLGFTAIFEANLYDAVFNTNGGTFPDGDSIKRVPTAYNSAIAVPQSPERKGYEFAGWAYNGKNIGTNLGSMDSVEGKTFEAIWASNNTTLYKIETYTMNTLGEYEVSSIVLNATAFEEITVNPVASEGFEVNTEKSVLSGVVSNEEMLVLKVYLDRKQYSLTTVIDNTETSVMYYYGSIITEPETPVKDGYVFVGWDSEIPATMPANDVTITAKFEKATQDTIFPRIEMVTPGSRTVYYGETITLQVRTYNLPEGARVKWEVSGNGVSIKPSASGKSCKVTSTSNGNVVIKAYIVDSNGNTIAGKDGKPIYDFEYLYSEVNFWQMIINFIKQLFGKTDVVSQMFRVIY